jgi:hypothetical protein
MAAGATTQAGLYAKRARGIWLVLALSTSLFCVICAFAGTSAYGFLNSLTRPQHARVQLVRGTQLSVIRSPRLESEIVSRETSVNEADQIITGRDTEANVDLFGGSTVLLSFDTRVKLSGMHTSRFFGNRSEISLYIEAGTALLSTAGEDPNSSTNYGVTTGQAVVQVEPNSTVRVYTGGSGSGQTTIAAVIVGSATVTSGGGQVQLRPGTQTTVATDNAPGGPEPEVQELVRNGDFVQPATSRAEGPEIGLDTAAWQPVIERSGDETTGVGTVRIITETVGSQSIHTARIKRESGTPIDGKPGRTEVIYGKVGLRQEINASVSYFHLIELNATVKVVAQTEPVAGPQEDVYPLTIRVLYTDSNNKQQVWWHSFYYCPSGPGVCKHENATDVPLGQYFTPDSPLVVKRIGGVPASNTDEPTPATDTGRATPTPLPDVGPGIAVINAIEIYGIGSSFQSWITHISLTAR